MRRFLLRGGRVVLNTVVGVALLAAGGVMLLTPGPGIAAIVLGLAVLAREYRWAERLKRSLLARVRGASTAARARLAARRGRRGPGADAAPVPVADDTGPFDAEAPGTEDVRPAS